MTTPTQKIEILPEDLDKAVEATTREGKWSNHYCLLAQVGMRVLGETEVIYCGYYEVTMKSRNKICASNKAKTLVERFDNAVSCIQRTGKVDEPALTHLRSLLPIDITPTP